MDGINIDVAIQQYIFPRSVGKLFEPTVMTGNRVQQLKECSLIESSLP